MRIKQAKNKTYLKNRQANIERTRMWRQNPEYREYQREYSKKWRERNKAKSAKVRREWRDANKYTIKANKAQRRYGNDISVEVVQRVYEDNIKKHGTLTCILCNKVIEFGKDSLDHLTPLTRGGTNDYSNLAIVHLKCNHRKYNKTLNEWKDIKYATIRDRL